MRPGKRSERLLQGGLAGAFIVGLLLALAAYSLDLAAAVTLLALLDLLTLAPSRRARRAAPAPLAVPVRGGAPRRASAA
jgi:hypothetical protein